MGLLVIPALIAVMSFAPWLEYRAFAGAAAAEAARAAVLAEADPTAAGIGAVTDMATGRDVGLDRVSVSMCGGTCALARGGIVTAAVTVEVPMVETPWGGLGSLSITRTHAEPVDAYRSLP